MRLRQLLITLHPLTDLSLDFARRVNGLITLSSRDWKMKIMEQSEEPGMKQAEALRHRQCHYTSLMRLEDLFNLIGLCSEVAKMIDLCCCYIAPDVIYVRGVALAKVDVSCQTT